MSITLTALMKQRYDTAANWTAQNPTLLAGEIGIESDTKKWKVGTGATAWTGLAYAIGGTYPIVNADIAAGAAIAYSKLATLTSGNVVLGSAANVATSTAVTGDVTISNTGVTAIAAGVIVNADINASAAIEGSKIVAATTSAVGAVQLSDSTSTTSSVLAATPTAVKAAYDLANAALPKAGGTMTGVLAVTAGTAALPGLAVSGDLNTGITSPGADQLAISTGGTVKATIDTGRLLVGTSTLPTGSSSGSITATNSIFTSGNVQGQYAGEGSITAITGTAVFKFKTVNTGNNRACFVKLSVFGRGGSTTVSNSPAAEYAFQLHMTNSNVMTLNGAASIFEYTFIRATHFAFANLGGGEGTVTIANPVAIALSVGYKIEILNAPAAGVFYLDSVTYA